MRTWLGRGAGLVAMGWLALAAAHADDDKMIGRQLFDAHCAACHSATPAPRAMTPAEMAKLPPEKIFAALTVGQMMPVAASLGEIEKRAVAVYASGIEWGSVPIPARGEEQLQRCAASPPIAADALDQPHWSGWGLDADNTHFQPAAHAGLTAADLPDLELKWAFGFPGGTTVSTQPAVVGGRLFLGSHEGGIYALDARTGCAHWKFPTPAAVRGAILVERRPDGRFVLITGDRSAHVYALDADTGELIWQVKVDDHPYALVTGSIARHGDVLYVPVASFEELAGASPKYECCTFRGSVVALDAQTGRQIWKSYVIPEAPVKTEMTTTGTQLWGPSGAAVWSQPTVDAGAGVLYVTTGDSYSAPAATTSDAVVAMDLQTGAIRWHMQATPDDAFSLACVSSQADPVVKDKCGPDVDFGASAILRRLPDGRRVLLAGQKSGVLHALDPDANGKVLWQQRLSPGGVLGGIEWGLAADDTTVYVPISDVWESKFTHGAAGGVYAVRIADGAEAWNTPAARPDCEGTPGCNAGQPAAATLIPGVLFSGSMDGHMRAYDPATGKVIWDVDTKGSHPTVNGVPAHGGAIKGAGVTVVDGWVYFGSGYGLWGMPGNVFLAYGPKAK
ncbi:MAG: PQQ-binding-like beta-propeller repeat protein [Gammaproteobacteria bacterium]